MNRNNIVIGIFSLLLLFVSSVKAEVTCDTRLGGLEFEEFRTWITKVQQVDCASSILAEYPELARVDVGDDPVAATSAYQATVNAFLSIISRGSFDPEIVSGIDTLKLKWGDDAGKFYPVLFSLTRPDQDELSKIIGTVNIDKKGVGRYKTYAQHCVPSANDNACALWEKTARLVGAMNFTTAGYRQVINAHTLDQFRAKLDATIDKWDDYFEQRKPQLPWEMVVNQVANRGVRTKPYFTLPPRGDWIVLHPALVYSHIGDAPDGEQDEAALAIELVGYNRWEREYLSGFSVVAINSDRASVDDTGYGLMLHFRSHYSLGWSKNGDDEGWFVSIDLLNAVDDKRKQIRAKRDEFRTEFEAAKPRLKALLMK